VEDDGFLVIFATRDALTLVTILRKESETLKECFGLLSGSETLVTAV